MCAPGCAVTGVEPALMQAGNCDKINVAIIFMMVDWVGEDRGNWCCLVRKISYR